MSQTSTGQISAEAAEIYEAFYLPALFQEWTPRMTDAARIGPAQRVLDVACGTGVLARALAPLVGAPGSVTGSTSTRACWPWLDARRRTSSGGTAGLNRSRSRARASTLFCASSG
jgi:hypothetical protein